jgi:hypothetical protein
MTYNNKRILIISDQHMPYHHQDMFKFLTAMKKKYKPTRIINIGDEVDGHGISFHGSDPDLMSPGDELIAAQKGCKKLEKIFPTMDLVDSNHGSLLYRRGKAGGIPRHMLKSYRDVLQVGAGWNWYPEIVVEYKDFAPVIFKHQFSANTLKNAEQMGCSTVQGHFHSKLEVQYTSSPLSLHYGMTVGCLIDKDSLAFEYNKLQTKRPILGCGVIIDGNPEVVAMKLNRASRWVGSL